MTSKTKAPTETGWTVVCVASRNYNVVDPEGHTWTDSAGTPMRFKTKAEALAEIEATKADLAATSQADERSVEDETESIAQMNRADRLVAAMTESHALQAWRAAGDTDPCNRPATPILDWMADPTTKPLRQPTGRHQRQKPVTRTAEQDQKLDAIIREGRTAGKSWKAIAPLLNEAGIPADRGEWTENAVYRVALDMGLRQTGERRKSILVSNPA